MICMNDDKKEWTDCNSPELLACGDCRVELSRPLLESESGNLL